jgi:hypothetical protein
MDSMENPSGFPHCPHRLDNLRRLPTFPQRLLRLIRFAALKTKAKEKSILQRHLDITTIIINKMQT